MTTALLFLVSLVLIVAAAEGFTNAVEWAGFRLRLGAGATGSLLAAIGTAMPETVVPAVALLSRQPNSEAVAVGAILGAPFLLLTVAIAVTGVAVLTRRGGRTLVLDQAQVRRDLGTFVVAYSLVLASLAFPRPVRVLVSVVLVGIYARYVVATLRGGEATEEMPEPLHLVRWRGSGVPHLSAVLAQLLLSVVGLIIGGEIFVSALTQTSAALGISALLLALVLVPIATELPEMLNAVLWVRSNDDRLAFGCVAGAAAFQACFLGAMGLSFTDWAPRGIGLAAAPITLVTAAVALVVLRGGRARGGVLLLAALPWAAWAVAAVAARPGAAT
ncbi:MAG: sodium:calcium antiporter [Candidatus Dormibacteria bacterium]